MGQNRDRDMGRNRDDAESGEPIQLDDKDRDQKPGQQHQGGQGGQQQRPSQARPEDKQHDKQQKPA